MEQNRQELKESLKSYLERFIPGVEKNIKHLRCENIDEAIKEMNDLFEGLQWIIRAFSNLREETAEQIDISELNGPASEMIDAFQNKDFMLLGDLLEFELIPLLTQWREGL